ncbi:MAG: ribosome recycling factor [Leptolyngbya sp. DLM2.Bin15]|uniref:ribosome recycling factor n=1 Tax=Leptolyngbya sp. CCY15150 TaxID=2767772 RepID=UPI00138626FD|nr:ribosome recycling factor [Synechococcales cyanobacterium K32_A2020_035]MBF2095253.1 ribosome recycling factor [Synechococcales cyanobacterium K44_A2020_017]TVQ22946.1 MAG: ribosome recycling factor [Leptolyngbya sp. DLM2.Bin15]
MKLAELEEHMQQTIEATQRSFNTIRTGRANASILDRVMVDYYGSPTPLKSLANISVPDSSSITIQPFDPGSMTTIEKAIMMSDLGLTPNNDGSTIRLNIPQLTSDRRKELVKVASKIAEEGKVALRNIRREAVDEVRKQEKNSDISEDESRDQQDTIQQITDKFVKKIDELLSTKEKDITTV